ncbi:unannotated protein [freshwater metagenome]|uniref:Unannotated protein n=1 Tax=freshwater metagenome TaxID=449393 RepID=A0A6J7GEJ1_9ZZZZ|nr:hypothetical protein [Actinomycetota bacterium]
MKYLFFFLLFPSIIYSQTKTPKDFGFRYIQLTYKGDNVDVLVKSKKGDENVPKPIFLFIQGSLPKPLIITNDNENYTYGVFPFNTDSIEKKYHLVIIGKPYTPLIVDKSDLSDFNYVDTKTNSFNKKYIERNLIDYYVGRNIKVLDYLLKERWIKKNKLVVASHSEGSTIGSKLCSIYPKITHFIYSGGNPFGRFNSIIQESRFNELTDTSYRTEILFNEWSKIVKEPNNMNNPNGDNYKGTYQHSIPSINYLRKLKIPVLVSYGTMDYSSPFNDYMRLEFIKEGRNNITFNSYIGLEHNFFQKDKMGKVNYEIFGWDKVSNDWLKWLDKK